tara:strand:+ start:21808 stop:21951 length:144 start_codon:yes stop_codon:yes gene_type:complete
MPNLTYLATLLQKAFFLLRPVASEQDIQRILSNIDGKIGLMDNLPLP